MTRLSLASRLALLFAACTAGVSLLAGVLFDRASEAHFVELDQQLLTGRLATLRGLLDGVGDRAALESRRPALEEELRRHPDQTLMVLGSDGQLWFGSEGSPLAPPVAQPGLHSWHDEASAFRELEAPLDAQRADSPRLRLLLDITHHQHFLQRMQRLIWLTVGLSALATALLGAWVARSGLRPLRKVAEVAGQVSARSLTQRLDERAAPAELGELIRAFNAMLARLDDAFTRLSSFSADIAHELRTPLSNLLTQTQVTLAQPRDGEVYREALHSNLEELQRLSQMVGDMLFLAKADHGLLVPNRTPLQLDEEIDALLEFYRPLADDAGVRLVRSGSGVLEADRGMLRRALSNLLDNALRFSLPGGEVRVDVESDERHLSLCVANTGPDIPAELLPRLFDRFFRADPARREGPGEHAGLGLAITCSIVVAHGGAIRCESAMGWTRFILDFPT